jgi:amidophosphoribosyltransferase
VLINVLAHELEQKARDLPLTPEEVFKAVAAVHKRIKGSYAVIALIAGYGLLAFRDPFGIRPLCLGTIDTPKAGGDGGQRVGGAGRHRPQDPARRGAGRGRLHRHEGPDPQPPVRREPDAQPLHVRVRLPGPPDSVMDGISVYQARLNMGETLASA